MTEDIKKLFKKLWIKGLVYGLILFSLGVVISAQVYAAKLVNIYSSSRVIIHNVRRNSFAAAWVIDEALTVSSSSVSISLYSDSGGSNPLVLDTDYTVSETNIKSNGVVQVLISGLASNTEYYLKTSTNVNGVETVQYPDSPPYLHVKTEISPDPDHPSQSLPTVWFKAMYLDMDTDATDTYIILDIDGVHYPVAGGNEISGATGTWPDPGFFNISFASLSGYVYNDSGDYIAPPEFKSGTQTMTIYCLGGTQGNRAIPISSEIPANQVCLTGIPDGCQNGANYIILAPNESGMEVEMTLSKGWNMASLPVETSLPANELFPEAKAIFRFTSCYELVDLSEPLNVGEGYWIYLPEGKTYIITGTSIEGNIIENAHSGWSMIGACSIQANVSVNAGTIRALFAFTNMYELVGSGNNVGPLNPGQAYWINLSEPATITITGIE